MVFLFFRKIAEIQPNCQGRDQMRTAITSSYKNGLQNWSKVTGNFKLVVPTIDKIVFHPNKGIHSSTDQTTTSGLCKQDFNKTRKSTYFCVNMYIKYFNGVQSRNFSESWFLERAVRALQITGYQKSKIMHYTV